MEFYEINDDTIAIIPIEYNKTRVIEIKNEYLVEKNAYMVMDESCKYYGSTYKGRIKAAKEILNCSYKIPILVEESHNIVFFPTKSSLEEDCCWINFNYIKNIEKQENRCIIKFINDKQISFDVSKLSIENQIARSTMLSYIIDQRKNKQKRVKNQKNPFFCAYLCYNYKCV